MDKDYKALMDAAKTHLEREEYSLFLAYCKDYFIKSAQAYSAQKNLECLLKKIPEAEGKKPDEVASGICSLLFEERS